MQRMKLQEDLIVRAQKTKNKTELCELLATLKLECKASDLPKIDRASCQEFFQEYKITTLLGKGSQGKVFAISSRTNDRVVKMFVNSTDEKATSFQRELFFIRYLQDGIVDAKPMVPRYYDSWQCKGEIVETKTDGYQIINRDYFVQYIVLERFDGDCSKMVTPDKEFDADHLFRLCRLCVGLGLLGVINGDIKLDNFLYRKQISEMEI